MTTHENMILDLQAILDLWDITYDSSDEKYVAKIKSFVILSSEQIGYVNNLGLRIFSIQKYEDTLMIQFSNSGNYFD